VHPRPASRACVFAHFDREGKVDQHVLFYLQKLSGIACQVVFVTVSVLDQESLNALSAIGVNTVQRDNVGYDFYSYKTGLEQLNLENFDEIVLCNDSVYGPFNDLSEVCNKMKARGADFWGITESHEYARHLQSYFLCFGRRVILSEEFREFWDKLEVLNNKSEIIRRYEVGLSQALLSRGFRADALVLSEDVGLWRRVRSSWRQYMRTMRRRWLDWEFYLDIFHILFLGRQIAVNPTHMEWKSLLIDHHSPFVKIELLRDNPKGIDDLDSISSVITTISDYPPALISSHLARVGQQSKQ
jgi:rhamnosyltransferase